MNTEKKQKEIKITYLLVGGFLLHFLTIWFYARSYTALYAIIEIGLMAFSFTTFMTNIGQIDKRLVAIGLALFSASILLGIVVNNEPKSAIMILSSIFLIFAVSTMKIDTTKMKTGVIIEAILSLGIMLLQTSTNFMGYINSNSISFLAYGGISLAFIWYESSSFKLFPIAFLAASLSLFFQTGSRNAAIVIVLLFILLLIPRTLLKKKVVYRSIYGGALAYTVFAVKIMKWGFSNPKIANALNDYASFSAKSWSMESRADFLFGVSQRVQELDLFTKLFGEGFAGHFSHNLFYQCVFTWGYVGTTLIYVMMIIIFEMGHQEVKKDNLLVLGAVLSLIGHIIINGADIYLFGTETCVVMPMLMFGLIVQQYMQGKREKEAIGDKLNE